MINLSNPIVLIVGGILLLALLYFWNKYNRNKQRNLRKRNFRGSYYERKKERDREKN